MEFKSAGLMDVDVEEDDAGAAVDGDAAVVVAAAVSCDLESDFSK
jgi:preprotein translocase subunit Sec61beta